MRVRALRHPSEGRWWAGRARTPAQRLSLVARLQRQQLAQHGRQVLPHIARHLLPCGRHAAPHLPAPSSAVPQALRQKFFFQKGSSEYAHT